MEASYLIHHHHVPKTYCPARSRSSLRSSHFMVGACKSIRLDLNNDKIGRGVLGIKAGEKDKDIFSVKKGTPYTNYAVSLDNPPASFYITRSLVEILRDLNKRVPDKIIKIKQEGGSQIKYIPWYHANRMLSFYAPGWLGEIRSLTFSDDARSVSVVYRVTIRGSDGEAYRESSGTVFLEDNQCGDPVQKAEEIAFTRACARFGLGLYLYHEDETAKDSNI